MQRDRAIADSILADAALALHAQAWWRGLLAWVGIPQEEREPNMKQQTSSPLREEAAGWLEMMSQELMRLDPASELMIHIGEDGWPEVTNVKLGCRNVSNLGVACGLLGRNMNVTLG